MATLEIRYLWQRRSWRFPTIFPRVSTGDVVPTASTLVNGERDAVLVDGCAHDEERVAGPRRRVGRDGQEPDGDPFVRCAANRPLRQAFSIHRMQRAMASKPGLLGPQGQDVLGRWAVTQQPSAVEARPSAPVSSSPECQALATASAGAGESGGQLRPRLDVEFCVHLPQMPLHCSAADVELRRDLRVGASRARRATCVSCGVSSSRVSAARLRARSPLAMSSCRARSAKASMPSGLNVSKAAFNSRRASRRRPARRSHSP